MEIRQKITYLFMSIVALLLFLSLLLIYLLFSNLQKEGFEERLSSKAKSIAQLIAETDNIEPSLLARIEKNNPTSLPKEFVIVYNLENNIIYKSYENSSITYSKKQINQIKTVKELYFKNEELDVYGFYYEGDKEKVIVFCSAEDVFGLRKLRNLALILMTVFFSSLIAVYFAGRIFSTRALTPIAEVINQVNDINISNINTRVVAGSGNDEIAKLAETFNKMLIRIEDAFKIQKDFIANSSHELRTPLTAITGQLEVTLLKERSTEEYQEAFISALEEIKSLNALTNRLLLLTKVTSYSSPDVLEKVRVDEILWKVRAEIMKQNKSFIINIIFDNSIADESHFYIIGNEELLKTAFRNLITNGCKYSSDNKTELILSAIDNNMQLTFKDQGIGIPDAELKNIFQPFYRASNVKKKRGHGIGLSLVEKIILLHHGSISVHSKLKKGTEFIVLFPFN